MQYSSLVTRIGGEGAQAWAIHSEAVAARRRGEDIILLSVGDPDFDTPKPIVDAAISGLRAGDTHYTAVVGTRPLREAVAAHFAGHGGWAATADNVCIVSGAQNGLFFASLLVLQGGDEVIVPEPHYVTYEATIAASGARPVFVPSGAQTGFRPDIAAIAAAVTPKTRAIMLANPNNPTGVVMTPEELEGIAALAREHDLWVISDEVYSTLTFEGTHHCIAALPGMSERTVTISSLSKSHAMTGWRSGWLIGPRELIEHAANLALCVLYGLPGFVQRAALEALTHGDAQVQQMRDAYRARRDLVIARLGEVPGIRPLLPQAGMFLMLDVRGTGLSAHDFAWRLLREEGVSVLDATAFGPGAAGHVRLSFGCDEATLEEACVRIARFATNMAAG